MQNASWRCTQELLCKVLRDTSTSRTTARDICKGLREDAFVTALNYRLQTIEMSVCVWMRLLLDHKSLVFSLRTQTLLLLLHLSPWHSEQLPDSSTLYNSRMNAAFLFILRKSQIHTRTLTKSLKIALTALYLRAWGASGRRAVIVAALEWFFYVTIFHKACNFSKNRAEASRWPLEMMSA